MSEANIKIDSSVVCRGVTSLVIDLLVNNNRVILLFIENKTTIFLSA